MSKQYDNTNKGVLFANKDRKSDKHPNAKGSINIDGKEYWLSAWTYVSKAGDRYQSLSVQPKDEEPAQKAAPAQNAADPDDDIPF